MFFFKALIAGSVFAVGNRDGVRQSVEAGMASLAVSLVNANGATVATTRTNARGEYVFSRLDIGSYRVVVAPTGGPAVTGRVVPITRGGAVSRIDVGLPPAAPRPAPRLAATASAPTPSATAPLAMDAAFAGLGGSTLGTGRRLR